VDAIVVSLSVKSLTFIGLLSKYPISLGLKRVSSAYIISIGAGGGVLSGYSTK